MPQPQTGSRLGAAHAAGGRDGRHPPQRGRRLRLRQRVEGPQRPELAHYQTFGREPFGEGDLRDFVARLNPANRRERRETERLRGFTCGELVQRGKVSLDILWPKDESREDTADLRAPGLLARDISENRGAALQQFNGIYESLTATPD